MVSVHRKGPHGLPATSSRGVAQAPRVAVSGRHAEVAAPLDGGQGTAGTVQRGLWRRMGGWVAHLFRDRSAGIVPWVFRPVNGTYYYHGTTLFDVAVIVASGGLMTPQVSQFSLRWRDAVGYGRTRQHTQAEAGCRTPMVLLQFPIPSLAPLVGHDYFQPAVSAALMMDLPPIHAAYVAAERPVPLALMTLESKQGVVAYLAAQAAEDAALAALLPPFETVLGASARPADVLPF